VLTCPGLWTADGTGRKLLKVIKSEAKAEKAALHVALKELAEIQKLQKESIKVQPARIISIPTGTLQVLTYIMVGCDGLGRGIVPLEALTRIERRAQSRNGTACCAHGE
jgi:hypothetical protein